MIDDLPAFPKAQILAAVRRLRAEPEAGKPLGGSLRGYRSIRVGGSENRLVYRIVDIGGRQAVEVVALDRRRDNAAYAKAERRAQPSA